MSGVANVNGEIWDKKLFACRTNWQPLDHYEDSMDLRAHHCNLLQEYSWMANCYKVFHFCFFMRDQSIFFCTIKSKFQIRNLLYAWISCWNKRAASGFAGLAALGSVRSDCNGFFSYFSVYCIKVILHTCSCVCV